MGKGRENLQDEEKGLTMKDNDEEDNDRSANSYCSPPTRLHEESNGIWGAPRISLTKKCNNYIALTNFEENAPHHKLSQQHSLIDSLRKINEDIDDVATCQGVCNDKLGERFGSRIFEVR